MNCDKVIREVFGRSWSSKDTKCDKILPDGKVCGKSLGNCMHTWITTKFGARPQ